MRVLVVDDELALAENVAEILMTAGHHADIATSAEDALVRLRMSADAADVLLTDYRLPGANGADLIRAARSLGIGIPALVITAFAGDDVIESAIDAGAADVLTKPVDFDRVISWVASVAARV
jgi:CheY-like chemotaxis protein